MGVMPPALPLVFPVQNTGHHVGSTARPLLAAQRLPAPTRSSRGHVVVFCNTRSVSLSSIPSPRGSGTAKCAPFRVQMAQLRVVVVWVPAPRRVAVPRRAGRVGGAWECVAVCGVCLRARCVAGSASAVLWDCKKCSVSCTIGRFCVQVQQLRVVAGWGGAPRPRDVLAA